ncbi:hypothetical protein CHS0354_042142 [Potamilus streckersoni]|uniref:Uncharacterized protein n=1 Tax=Potamilus streckersoni TaxID=2493646 RepID=A0AAE0WHV9_9BIVA|nr:hypothetical protein CHS0354_042142 [Potamilus streckersoni]
MKVTIPDYRLKPDYTLKLDCPLKSDYPLQPDYTLKSEFPPKPDYPLKLDYPVNQTILKSDIPLKSDNALNSDCPLKLDYSQPSDRTLPLCCYNLISFPRNITTIFHFMRLYNNKPEDKKLEGNDWRVVKIGVKWSDAKEIELHMVVGKERGAGFAATLHALLQDLIHCSYQKNKLPHSIGECLTEAN